MANLKEIRHRIKSVKTTQQTTKAMKMVSAAKLKKAQNMIIQMRPYATRLNKIMQNAIAGTSDFISEYAIQRPVNKVLLIVVTSNKGLCGAFNSSIVKLTKATIESQYQSFLQSGNLKILCIGKKGYEAFKKTNIPLVGENHDLFSKIDFDKVSAVAEFVMNGFLNKEWDKVDFIYNEFKNAATQIKKVEQFLPVLPPPVSEAPKSEYIFEPSSELIIQELVPKILKLTFYKVILDSNAAEHGQRMVSMDTATENAGQLINQLKLKFNKERQAAITKELLEIVGAAEALAGNN